MNESFTDPVLRTFRMPITVRLREKIDTQREVIDAQAATIRHQTREVTRLERDLKRARKQVDLLNAEALAAIEAKGVVHSSEIITVTSPHTPT